MSDNGTVFVKATFVFHETLQAEVPREMVEDYFENFDPSELEAYVLEHGTTRKIERYDGADFDFPETVEKELN